MRVRYFEKNTKGRDIVAGDIHGSFDLLNKALAAIAFDPVVDRLFILGDLIDKGRFSPAALSWLNTPGVYSLYGNHEGIYCSLFDTPVLNQRDYEFHLAKNGIAWTLDQTPAEKLEYCKAFRYLPIAMEIQTDIGLVGLVHANVPLKTTWDAFLALLTNDDATTCHNAVWDRSRYEFNLAAPVPGVARIYFGHTIVPTVRELGNMYYMDTGAFTQPKGYLTLANITAKRASLLAGPTEKERAQGFRFIE